MNTVVIMRRLNNMRSLLDGLAANLWGRGERQFGEGGYFAFRVVPVDQIMSVVQGYQVVKVVKIV